MDVYRRLTNRRDTFVKDIPYSDTIQELLRQFNFCDSDEDLYTEEEKSITDIENNTLGVYVLIPKDTFFIRTSSRFPRKIFINTVVDGYLNSFHAVLTKCGDSLEEVINVMESINPLDRSEMRYKIYEDQDIILNLYKGMSVGFKGLSTGGLEAFVYSQEDYMQYMLMK